MLVGASVAGRLGFMSAAGVTHEDALITLRCAENLAQGVGLNFNPGERVLSTTTPLYAIALSVVAALNGPALLSGKLANIAADAVTTWLLTRIGAHLGHARVGLLASALYALSFAPVCFATGGMETGLVTVACTAALHAYVCRRERAMGVALGALFLLRVDGLALAAALLAGWWWRERRFPSRALLAGGFVVLPWLVGATAYYGNPLPSSVLSKLTVYHRTQPGPLPNLAAMVHYFAGGPPQKLLLAVFVVGAVVAWRTHRSLRCVLLWVVVYYGAMLLSRVPVGAFGWYFVPPLPTYYLVAALGGRALVVEVMARRSRPLRRALGLRHTAIALAVTAVLALGWHLRSGAHHARVRQADTEDSLRRPIGLWLAANTSAGERVMLEPIGYIGYYSGRPVLDVIGLASPQVRSSYRATVRYPLGDIADRFRPELMLLRRAERDEVAAHGRAAGRDILGREYTFVRAWPDQMTGPVFFLYRRIDAPAPKRPAL